MVTVTALCRKRGSIGCFSWRPFSVEANYFAATIECAKAAWQKQFGNEWEANAIAPV